jgi:hypothetical protein
VRVRWVTPIVIMTHGETMAQLGRDGALTMECITSIRYFLTSLLVVATECCTCPYISFFCEQVVGQFVPVKQTSAYSKRGRAARHTWIIWSSHADEMHHFISVT